MQAIQHTGTIGSIRAKVDRSVGYTVSTPELSSEEKVLLMDMQNEVLTVTLTPLNAPDSVVVPVKATMDKKSQASRIRSVCFVLWQMKREKKLPVPQDFETYYQQLTEWLIEKIKSQIEEIE